jgi:hypothetical protein
MFCARLSIGEYAHFGKRSTTVDKPEQGMDIRKKTIS